MQITDKRFEFLLALLLMTATLSVYWQLGSHGFINYDDPEYVYENPFVRMGLTHTSLEWAFTTFHSANWHPVTWLSHMTDVQLFGLEPWGHHMTSLILHTANVLLLFFLLCRLTGFPWRSMVVAALFALHPLHVESVAWVAERKDLVSTFFCLLTINFYIDYIKSTGRGYYLLATFTYVAGLMAKPMLVTLPFVLLLLDYWPLHRLGEGVSSSDTNDTGTSKHGGNSFKHLILEKVPLFVLAGISCIITLNAQHSAGAVKSLTNYPLPTRVANAVVVYVDYLYKMIWPLKLAVFYPFPKTIGPGHLVAAACVLTGITVVSLYSRRKHPYGIFGWLWYLGTLVPVIGLVQAGGQAAADRYTYLPLTGIFIAIVWGLCDYTARFSHRKIFLTTISVVMLTACAVVTRKQVSYWKNDLTLYSHALAVTDDNYVAHNNLGFALESYGRYSEAGRHFDEAIRIAPAFADAYLNKGDNLLRTGAFAESIPYITRSIELRPDFAAAYNDLGVAMLRMGRLNEASANFTRAVDLDPFMADGSYNMGIILSKQGRSDEAIGYYRRALQLNPDNANYHVKMGVELARMKRFQEAAGHFSEALRLNPNDVPARQYLGQLSTGRSESSAFTK